MKKAVCLFLTFMLPVALLAGTILVFEYVPPSYDSDRVLSYSFLTDTNPTPDTSGFGNDGVVSGATWNASEWYDFDGTDDWIEAADAASLDLTNGLTLAAWVKFDDTNSIQGIIMKTDDNTNRSYAFLMQSRTLNLQLASSPGGAANTYDTRSPIFNTITSTSEWYHVAVTWDGTPNDGVQFYTNGVASTTTETLENLGASLNNSTEPVAVGRKSDGGWYMDGSIDEPRIWDRQLSSEEINALWSSQLSAHP